MKWLSRGAKITVWVSMLAITGTAFAQQGATNLGSVGSGSNGGSQPVNLPNPISATSFTQVVASITTFLIEIAIPLTAIMVLVGGFQMITAGGNPEKFSSGRKTLTYAAIGFAVVLLASGVATIIKSFLGT